VEGSLFAPKQSKDFIQLLIVAIAGSLWAAMWSLSDRIWPVKDDPNESDC